MGGANAWEKRAGGFQVVMIGDATSRDQGLGRGVIEQPKRDRRNDISRGADFADGIQKDIQFGAGGDPGAAGDDAETAGTVVLRLPGASDDGFFGAQGKNRSRGRMVAGLSAKSAVLAAMSRLGIDNGTKFGPLTETGFPQPVGSGQNETQIGAPGQ